MGRGLKKKKDLGKAVVVLSLSGFAFYVVYQEILLFVRKIRFFGKNRYTETENIGGRGGDFSERQGGDFYEND